LVSRLIDLAALVKRNLFDPKNIRITNGMFFPYCDIEIEHPTTKRIVAFSSDDLRIEVDLSGEYGANPQIGTVSVMNLAPQTSAFIRNYMNIRIKLGYRDGLSNVVLNGIIKRREPNAREGADIRTSFSVLDTTWLTTNLKVEHVYVNQDVSDIVQDLHARIGVAAFRIEKSGIRVPRLAAGPKSVNTTTRELMDQYITPTGKPWKYHIRQGSLVFASMSLGVVTSVVLSPDTGLISCEPIGDEQSEEVIFNKNLVGAGAALFNKPVKDTSADDAQTLAGSQQSILGDKDVLADFLAMRSFQFDSAMQPLIVADSIVFVNSFRTKGLYRVKSYRHAFSSESFRTSGTITPVSQTDLGADLL